MHSLPQSLWLLWPCFSCPDVFYSLLRHTELCLYFFFFSNSDYSCCLHFSLGLRCHQRFGDTPVKSAKWTDYLFPWDFCQVLIKLRHITGFIFTSAPAISIIEPPQSNKGTEQTVPPGSCAWDIEKADWMYVPHWNISHLNPKSRLSFAPYTDPRWLCTAIKANEGKLIHFPDLWKN